jgi:hypothetical protein
MLLSSLLELSSTGVHVRACLIVNINESCEETVLPSLPTNELCLHVCDLPVFTLHKNN